MIGLTQSIANQLAAEFPTTNGGRLRRFVAHRLRKLILQTHDPVIRFKIGNHSMVAPLSHDLSINMSVHPLYNRNLGRLVSYVHAQYPDTCVIDIGANIGDSAAFIRCESDAPVLCIEGNAKFIPLLEKNTQELQQVFVEKAFVGNQSAELRGDAEIYLGSSRITLRETGDRLTMRTLGDIVNNHPRFQRPRFIKIDTDGFDIPIIRGALPFLQETQPILFFEYDPVFFRPLDEDGVSVFSALREIGYGTALFYDNLGDLVVSTTMGESRLLEDLHSYFDGGKTSQRYCDICVFPDRDSKLAMDIRERERAFYKQVRCTSARH